MNKLPAKQHLKELRNRSLIVAIFFIVGACLAYSFQPQVIDAVLAPLKGQKLVYLNPAGGFNFIFLIAIYAGLALAIPVLIQQLYAFIRPALPESAQKKSSSLIIGSFLLLVAGVLFGYFVAVPNALAFLYSFADAYIDASLTADSYLNFIIAYTIGIGLVFQIPLLLLLINSIKPLTPGTLMKSEKWVLLVSVIIAAIITPTPDPVNQLIIAGPVIIVYQIGVVIILVSLHKKYRATKRDAKKVARMQKFPEVKQTSVPLPYLPPQPVAAPVLIQSATQVKKHSHSSQNIHTVARQKQAMDGFIRPVRHTTQPMSVPKRTQVQSAARNTPNQRNFNIDGIYRQYPSSQTAVN